MAKRAGMYSSNKRKKELKRQKKQEDKRLKRLKGVENPPQGSDATNSVEIDPVETAPESPEIKAQETD